MEEIKILLQRIEGVWLFKALLDSIILALFAILFTARYEKYKDSKIKSNSAAVLYYDMSSINTFLHEVSPKITRGQVLRGRPRYVRKTATYPL